MNETSTDETDGTNSSPDLAQAGDDPMVIFEFSVPADAFALAQTLREFPDAVVECEQIVPSDHHQIPYIWTTVEENDAFRASMDDEPSVQQITKVASFDSGALYGLQWDVDDDGLLHWFADHTEHTAVLEASAHGDEWTLKLRFQSRTHLSEFRAFADERAIDVCVVRLYDLTRPKMGEYNITEKQREALLRALEMGHFEIPREATLEDVADSLGISARSVSERLRRGQTNLISNTIPVGNPTGVGL